MTHADLITFNRFVARLPATFGRVPRMLRGLYYTAIRNREKSLSLGWALEKSLSLGWALERAARGRRWQAGGQRNG